MSKKRYFDTKFWSDTWVVDELNQLDRYLFMYLMLNEKTNIAGVYELSLRTMSFETGIESRDLATMLKRLEPKVFYRNGWVVLTNAIKHQNYKNKFIAEGIRTELCKAPADLLELVHIPEDMDYDLSCPIEDSSGDLQDSRVIKSNLIKSKSNITKPNAAKAAGVSKKPSKTQYAKAVKADEELKAKEQEARTRSTGKGYQSFASAGELLRKRKP